MTAPAPNPAAPVRKSFRIDGALPDAFFAFADAGGRVALFGGVAGRDVRVVEADPPERIVLEGTPWPGRTTVRLSAEHEGTLAVDVEVEPEAGPGGARAAAVTRARLAGATVVSVDLDTVVSRLAMALTGTLALDVLVRGSVESIWAALVSLEAVRAFGPVEIDGAIPASLARVEPGAAADADAGPAPADEGGGRSFWWTWLDESDEALDAGRFVEADPGHRLAFEWFGAPGSQVEISLYKTGTARAVLGPRPAGEEAPPVLVTLQHAGFTGPGTGAALRAHARRWLGFLEGLRDLVEGTVRAEREILAARAEVAAALAARPPGPGAIVEVPEAAETEGRTVARYERSGIAGGAGGARAYATALGAARLYLVELAARATGALRKDGPPWLQAPLADEDPEEVPGMGPRAFRLEATLSVPPDLVFRAIAWPAERARWGPPAAIGADALVPPPAPGAETAPPHSVDFKISVDAKGAGDGRIERRLVAARGGRALEEVWILPPDGQPTVVRFDLERAEGGGTRLTLAQAGFPAHLGGGVDARALRLGWAFHLLNLRAFLERGLDLRRLSRTRVLYTESVETEITIQAPPAQLAAEIAADAKARAEIFLGTDGRTRVETIRPLERPSEVSVCEYRLERDGTATRLVIEERGFGVEEDFWGNEEKFRLVPAFALSRADEQERLDALALALDAEYGRTGTILREVEAEAPAAVVFAALTEGRQLAAWLGGPSSCEPWPGGRFAWGGERADAGEVVDVEPGRSLTLVHQAIERPTLASVAAEGGSVRRTTIRVSHSGFAGAPELMRSEAALWDRRLAALAEYVEGRASRSVDVPASVERVARALREAADLRAWLDPEARLEPASADAPEGAIEFDPARTGLPERCRITLAEPRRFAVEWPWAGEAVAEGGDEVGPGSGGAPAASARPAVTFVLEEAAEDGGSEEGSDAGPSLARVTATLSGIPETFARPDTADREGLRLEGILSSLRAFLEREAGGGKAGAPSRGEARKAALRARLRRGSEARRGAGRGEAAARETGSANRTKIEVSGETTAGAAGGPPGAAGEGSRAASAGTASAEPAGEGTRAVSAGTASAEPTSAASPPAGPAGAPGKASPSPSAAARGLSGSRRLEVRATVPPAPADAFAALAGRLRADLAFSEEAPPRRLVARRVDAAGRLTLVLVEVTAGPAGAGSQVRVVEDGFADGPDGDERLAAEERGWWALLASLEGP